MVLFPAIDIKNGKCVRLRQGKFDDLTVYNDDPVVAACAWRDQGAEYIHVVDLDGAREGTSFNLGILTAIAEETGLPIQTGGGIRSMENIQQRLDAGATRVIIGTKAVMEPEFVREALARYGNGKIVVGLDGRGEAAATYGWEQESTKTIIDLAREFALMGVATIVYTDITRDGMMTGPNIEYTRKLVDKTGIEVIASGGVSSLSDLDKLKRIGATGAILGKALYEGKLELADAVAKYRA